MPAKKTNATGQASLFVMGHACSNRPCNRQSLDADRLFSSASVLNVEADTLIASSLGITVELTDSVSSSPLVEFVVSAVAGEGTNCCVVVALVIDD